MKFSAGSFSISRGESTGVARYLDSSPNRAGLGGLPLPLTSTSDPGLAPPVPISLEGRRHLSTPSPPPSDHPPFLCLPSLQPVPAFRAIKKLVSGLFIQINCYFETETGGLYYWVGKGRGAPISVYVLSSRDLGIGLLRGPLIISPLTPLLFCRCTPT